VASDENQAAFMATRGGDVPAPRLAVLYVNVRPSLRGALRTLQKTSTPVAYEVPFLAAEPLRRTWMISFGRS
jgi:hypothetical protein